MYICPAYHGGQDPSHFRCIQRFYCRKQAVSLRYPNNISIRHQFEKCRKNPDSKLLFWSIHSKAVLRHTEQSGVRFSLTLIPYLFLKIQLNFRLRCCANSWKQSQQEKWKQGKNNLDNDWRAREQEIQEQELQNYKLGSWLNDERYKSKLLPMNTVIWLLNSWMYQAQRQLSPTNAVSKLHKELFMVKFKA